MELMGPKGLIGLIGLIGLMGPKGLMGLIIFCFIFHFSLFRYSLYWFLVRKRSKRIAITWHALASRPPTLCRS